MKKVAVVKFPSADRWSTPSNKEYNFVTDIEDLKQGDKVVVDTVNGLTIAEFVKYDDLGFGSTGEKTPTKWVIQKIDLVAHKERVAAAQKVIKLKTMMEAKRKKAQELEIYEILAQNDPEMAKMVEEFKQLQGVL